MIYTCGDGKYYILICIVPLTFLILIPMEHIFYGKKNPKNKAPRYMNLDKVNEERILGYHTEELAALKRGNYCKECDLSCDLSFSRLRPQAIN